MEDQSDGFKIYQYMVMLTACLEADFSLESDVAK